MDIYFGYIHGVDIENTIYRDLRKQTDGNI